MSYALITGASKGIGKAIAEELALKGFNILLIARSENLLRENTEEIKKKFKVECEYLAADLADPASVQSVFNWCNENNYPVSILVNNAGFGIAGPFDQSVPTENLDMMQVNMITPVLLCQAFIPLLRQQPKAYILNVGSTTAYHAIPLMALYAASKVFILRFSRGLHEELKGTNISVTCVCPGTTDTDFSYQARVNPKAIKTGEKVSMTPAAVARISVKGMMKKKKEVVPGFVNKLTVFLVWLLPLNLSERTAFKIYRQ
ncbi:MAG TPA: SDR family oxidoreductase [Hanamia sp.]|nr:SDR family oxidoreductase [Hanamia sp.]